MARSSVGGLVYHVLNRGNARTDIFDDAEDYQTFEAILESARRRSKMRILAYCLMPNHWHLVLWPRQDGDLSRFMFLLGTMHTRRWHARRQSDGMGHLYQGRYKSFPIECDDHFLTVCRYVERNALRARLVQRAEHWRWSSLWRRGNAACGSTLWLDPWPVEPPSNWLERVNAPETVEELERIRRSVKRNRPYGSPVWQVRAARKLGLESTIRRRGRPQKKTQPK